MYVQERVWLFWVRQSDSALQGLSTNVLREVCSYIDEELMLPRYRNGTLSLFRLASREILNFSEAPAFPAGTVLCYIGNFKVQYLGRSTSTWILTRTGLHGTASMAEGRYYPGCIHYAHYVYAFGGSNATPRSAEKYSVLEDRWTALSPMAVSRYAFSPVRQGQKIYLAEVNEASHLLEAFDTETQTFTVLSSSLPFAGYSSIAYIFQSELVIVDFKGTSKARSGNGVSHR